MTRVRKYQVPNSFGDRSTRTEGYRDGRSRGASSVSVLADPWHEDEPREPKREAAPLRRGASHTFREPKDRYGKAGG